MNREDGGPAFPIPYPIGQQVDGFPTGMSLRDWFAGKALEHAYPTLNPFAVALDEYRLIEMKNIAKQAYAYADAMLYERGRGEGSK